MKAEGRKLSRIFLFIIIGIIVPLIHACAQGAFTSQSSQPQQNPSANSRPQASPRPAGDSQARDRQWPQAAKEFANNTAYVDQKSGHPVIRNMVEIVH